jgi:protein TonB
MEAKKSKKADLENKRGLFLEIGMVVSLALVLLAFQWTPNVEQTAYDFNSSLDFEFEEEWLPINTEHQKQEELKQPPVVEVIAIVENYEDIPDVEVFDTEGSLEIPITIIDMGTEALDETEPETFYIVEEMPVYPGGDKGLMKDIMTRVVYPEIAKENGIFGKVYVKFVVNKHGEVADIKIERGVDPSLDREALRVIKTLTGWTPGRQRGKAVAVAYTVPINFRLN